MSAHRLLRWSAVIACIAAVAAGTTAAPAQTGAGSTATITAKGVGGVKLGKRYETLRRQGLVGKIRPGCELGGPNTRSAPLRGALRGSVDFTTRSPRRVRQISITRGASVNGVGIGSTIDEIRAAFPRAQVNRDTEEVFGITLVTIPKRDGGRFEFAVDTSSGQTTLIGIPRVAFCE